MTRVGECAIIVVRLIKEERSTEMETGASSEKWITESSFAVYDILASMKAIDSPALEKSSAEVLCRLVIETLEAHSALLNRTCELCERVMRRAGFEDEVGGFAHETLAKYKSVMDSLEQMAGELSG